MDTDHGPLGPCVVNSLLEVVENPVCHKYSLIIFLRLLDC